MCHFFLLTNFLSGQIEINQNDNVTINFYNMEAPTGDRHTFTIDHPYSVDLELAPERNGTVTFTVDNPGFINSIVSIMSQL
jgi:nitrous oxide reductase